MRVVLVETEHPPAADASLASEYATLTDRLLVAGARAVERVQYPSLGNLERADALVLSGSYAPWAVHDESALERLRALVLGYGRPVLGICAGMQLLARFTGGQLATAGVASTVGFTEIEVLDRDDLLAGLRDRAVMYQHHTDEVVELPLGFRVLARSSACAVEAIADPDRRWWGTQFHPERYDALHPDGQLILESFFRLARGD
jgi:GMP synthase (glutamine-hydrolysing)